MMKQLAVVVGLWALMGCGGPGLVSVPGGDDPAEPGLEASIRLTGEGVEGFQSFQLAVDDIRVFAGGQELAVERGGGMVELAQAGHSPLAGRIVVPAGVESVRVELTFGQYGLHDRDGELVAFQARGAPLSFEAPVGYLSERGHAVVHLNLGRSLARGPAEEVLLPSLDVRY